MKQRTPHGPHTRSRRGNLTPPEPHPCARPQSQRHRALRPGPSPPGLPACRSPRARFRLAWSAAGRRAGARLRSTPSLLCSFMIGTRPPETQPERGEGSRACGGRGGRARLPHRTRRWLGSFGRAGTPAGCPAPGRLHRPPPSARGAAGPGSGGSRGAASPASQCMCGAEEGKERLPAPQPHTRRIPSCSKLPGAFIF